MSEHLTPMECEDFGAHRIKGKERVRLLLHLEDCGDCRSLTTAPTHPEIIEHFLAKEHKPGLDRASYECLNFLNVSNQEG